MKKYDFSTVGAPVLVFCIFWNAILIFMLCMMGGAFSAVDGFAPPAIMFVIPALMLCFGVALFAMTLVRTVRYRNVLKNGREDVGTVVEFRYVYGGRSGYQRLAFRYRTDDGTEAISLVRVPFGCIAALTPGKSIPILRLGKYAVAEIDKISAASERIGKTGTGSDTGDTFGRSCPFCGEAVKDSDRYCKNCGAKLP